MEKQIRKNPWTRSLLILNTVLIIVVIILLLLNLGCGKKLASVEKNLATLSTEISGIEKCISYNDSLFSTLVKQNEKLIGKIDTLSDNISKLAGQISKSNQREAYMMKEISSIKKEIRTLQQKVDSIENGKVVSEIQNNAHMTSKVSEEKSEDSISTKNFVTKNLYFTLTKKVYNKNNTKVVNESKIADYSRNIIFVDGQGFFKDEYSKSYIYLNPESDSDRMVINYLVEGNSFTVSINKNESGLVYYEEANFRMGAGGLLIPEKASGGTQVNFLEKTIDYNLKRKANWEIAGGSLAEIVGGIGLWYFHKHPEAVIEINDSEGNQIFYTEISNDFGKAVSAGLIGFGSGLIVKGFIDKSLSIRINPTEIGLVYIIK